MNVPELVAFANGRKIASGTPQVVNQILGGFLGPGLVQLFDADGRHVELPLPSHMLTEDDGSTPKRGRPRLGVTGREVTLLPRQWAWLDGQAGGASASLRRLVDEARKSGRTGIRDSQDAAFRFMNSMAGDLRDFEEAIRALYAGNRERFNHCMASWPMDIREHAAKLAAPGFYIEK